MLIELLMAQMTTINLQSENCITTDRLCNYAADHGNFKLLQWDFLNKFTVSIQTAIAVASNGYLHIVKWLKRKGSSIQNNVYDTAVMNDHY